VAEPKQVDGWNVAELAGGLLLSAEGFILQLSTAQVDRFVEILNSGQPGSVRDSNGDVVQISIPERSHVILIRANDQTYPNGIILPVDVFSSAEDDEAPVIEGMRPAFRRVGIKIKRGFRVKAMVPPGIELKRRLVRALQAEVPRNKTASMVIRRLKRANDPKIPTASQATR
jgi:hypothetical protein